MTHVLAIDQGTTSSRAILFDARMKIAAVAQQEFAQHYPRSGWVEHDGDDLWTTTVATCRAAIARAGIEPAGIAAIGITNQRETTLVWDRASGRPVGRAIVWQDRRTADFCRDLREAGHEPAISHRTGLLLDPYFSATKLKWILDEVDPDRSRSRRSELLFGTVDSWLIWHLTGGRRHVTDATNASRTMLYDIRKGRWSSTMCSLFDVPAEVLPEVLDCAAAFGETDPGVFGRAIPIRGVAGDQQAATVGQACFSHGMMKSTYGTGCFALMNTGAVPVASAHRLLTTIAYQLGGRPTYALEGSIFIAGAVVQWLRDGLGLIRAAGETQALAEAADPGQEVVLVPAFTGLGAPYWNAECRGAIFGLTRNTGPAELAKAALESVAFQTRDLMEAMAADHADGAGATDTASGAAAPGTGAVLRVDGGMVVSDWTMQALADIIGAPVDRPEITETTALGAAWLAGMAAGVYPGQEDFARTWALERRFTPRLDAGTRDARYARWKQAVAATLSVV